MHDTNHQSRITNHVGYEIRENDMLENKAINPIVGAASAAIAALVFAASLLLLTSSAALADNECETIGVDPSANGATADSYECDLTSYGDGVTYTADGDLTVEFTNGGTTEAEDGGIDLSATGSDSITFDSATSGTEIESRNTVGALLGVTTVNGDIDINTDFVDADAHTPTDVTHGIYAESTGTGNIDINTLDNVDAASGTNPADSIGIEAIANGGDIIITTEDTVAGNQHGIRAVAGGSGDLTINAASRVDNGIDAVADSGVLTINVIGTQSGFGEGINGGIRVDTNATATINLSADRRVNGDIQATADALTLNNDGIIGGVLDFSGLAGGYTFNNNAGARWEPPRGSSSDLGAGALTNAGTIEIPGIIDISDIGGDATKILAPGSTFTGTGDSTLEMQLFLAGTGQPDCGNTTVAGCLDLQGGATAGQTSILVNGRFTSLITGPQTTVTTVNPGIVLVDVGGGVSEDDHFVLHPDSVLVESSGEGNVTTAAYAEDPIYGAVLDTSLLGTGGIFDYALLYNPDTQQHLLASVPASEGVEYVALIDEGMSIWHTTSDTVVSRQADLRDGATGRLWFRYRSDRSERDAAPTFTSQGNTFTYDRSYDLDIDTAIVGFDAVSGEEYVVGAYGGIVRSRLAFDDSSTRDKTRGVTVGSYAGWWQDNGLSLDGVLNFNSVTVDHEIGPGFENSDVVMLSLGLRGEAGWRVPLMDEALYVQPLATAAYVVSDIDDIDLRDNDLGYEDAQSLRGGLGVRVGGKTSLDNGNGNFGYWLTARAWEEYADEGEVRFETRDGGYLAIKDDRSGSFEEVNFGINASNRDDTLSGYLSAGATFGDDVDSYNFSIGARLNW